MSNIEGRPLTDFVVTVAPGTKFRLADVVIAEWDPIVALAPERGWAMLAENPLMLTTGAQVQAIFDLCCAKTGVESRLLTTNEAWHVFNREPDDRPTMYVGGLPDPKADEQVTTG